MCVCVLLSYQLLVCFEYSDRRNDSIKSNLGNDFCYVKSQDDFQAVLEIPTNVSKLNGENLAKLSMYLCSFCFVDSFMNHCLLCYLCSGSQNIPQLGKIFFANFRWGLLYFQTTSTGIKNGIFTQQVDLINHGLNRQRAEENEMDGIPFAERSLTYKELTDLNTVTHSLSL